MSENRGGSDAETFALCRERLERAVRGSCAPDRPWPARVAAGIGAALRFADADPAAARVLTAPAAFPRLEDGVAFQKMVDRFAELLVRGAPSGDDADGTARKIVLRIARQTLLQIESPAGATSAEIAPDLIVFALIPYLGFAEAQKWSASTAMDIDGTSMSI
jgi:hypothetical protein